MYRLKGKLNEAAVRILEESLKRYVRKKSVCQKLFWLEREEINSSDMCTRKSVLVMAWIRSCSQETEERFQRIIVEDRKIGW